MGEEGGGGGGEGEGEGCSRSSIEVATVETMATTKVAMDSHREGIMEEGEGEVEVHVACVCVFGGVKGGRHRYACVGGEHVACVNSQTANKGKFLIPLQVALTTK